MKLNNDAYFTSKTLAKRLIDKTFEVLGNYEISEVIEPSAGDGSFSLQIPRCIAYDIDPKHPSILKQDFLSFELNYKKNRLFIGNPPFGNRNLLSEAFYKKCAKLGDYIAFILPISQLNNNQRLFNFKLVYSEDLGKQAYSDRTVHCCFNIYVKSNENEKKKYIFNGLSIVEHRRPKINLNEDYDLRICAWGSAIGKQVKYPNQYAKEFLIKISHEQKVDIINSLVKANWVKLYPMTASPNLLQWQVHKYLIDNFKSNKGTFDFDQ